MKKINLLPPTSPQLFDKILGAAIVAGIVVVIAVGLWALGFGDSQLP